MSATICHTVTPAGSPAWLVTDHDTVRTLLSDPRLGLVHEDPAQAGRLSDSVIFGRPQEPSPTEGQEHAAMRRLLGQWFSARRLETFRPRMEELVDELLDELATAERPADFHRFVSFPLPALVICELLGVPYANREQFRRWSDDAADMYDHERSANGYAALRRYISELITTRLESPSDDLLSDLVTAHRAAPDDFTLEQATDLGLLLLFAGHETTVTAIDNGVVLLATHPEQQEALLRTPELLEGTVEEILRGSVPRMKGFTTPDQTDTAGALPRWANVDIDIADVTVRAGEMVLLGLAHANVDECVVGARPEFDITRRPNRHVTFGHGPHFCAGAPLARLELQVLFRTLTKRFPRLRLAVSVDELEPRPNVLTGGLVTVPVTW